MTPTQMINKQKNKTNIFLVEDGKFNARVIQRELAMITNLMTPENFENVVKDKSSYEYYLSILTFERLSLFSFTLVLIQNMVSIVRIYDCFPLYINKYRTYCIIAKEL